MERRNFIRLSALFACFGRSVSANSMGVKNDEREIYEWRIYSLKKGADTLDSFFKTQLIPAFNKLGIHVGAFKDYKEEEIRKQYYLFVYPDIASWQKSRNAIWQDKDFIAKSESFYNETATNPVYTNFETYLCQSFNKVPRLLMPAKEREMLELRIYRSPNEEANQRKIAMFNKEEIDIFDKVGIHSVCYGEVLAGPYMPAVMYLTWYNDLEARDAAWKSFGSHPDWQQLKNKKEYANTATNNTGIFLLPLDYSQL